MPRPKIISPERYLAGWKDLQGSHTRALQPLDFGGDILQALVDLAQLGYVISIAGQRGAYQVRCFPVARAVRYSLTRATLGYCGTEISAILAAAAYEADLFLSAPEAALLCDEERLRWVQS